MPLHRDVRTKYSEESTLILLTVTEDVLPHFSHRLTDSDVVVEELAVPPSIPLGEGGKLLGNGME